MRTLTRPDRHCPTPWSCPVCAPLGRLIGLDRLRGLAIALMVVDHTLLVVAPSAGSPVRLTLTRAALPLFCVVAGSLATRRLGRPLEVACWGVLLATVTLYVDAPFPVPGILLLLAVSIPLVGYLRAFSCAPHVAIAVGIVQVVTWPVPWGGYQPGAVMALVALGAVVPVHRLDTLGRFLPSWLAPPGRYPLSLYVGHVLALCAVVGFR